jgi:hypothetical protein
VASGATCVQRLDGSRDSAIHTRYRISLRSSSMREPRYPLPRVVWIKYNCYTRADQQASHALELHTVFLDAFGAVGSFTPSLPLRGGEGDRGRPSNGRCPSSTDWMTSALSVLVRVTTMILPQVHLRKPCYDFSFL